MTLFTVTENVDLLSLHFHQQNAEKDNEKSTAATGWIQFLGYAMNNRLRETDHHLLKHSEVHAGMTDEKIAIVLGLKMDAFARLLGLYPIKNTGKFKGNLKPVSPKPIQAVHIICPGVAVCQTQACDRTALYQWSRCQESGCTGCGAQ